MAAATSRKKQADNSEAAAEPIALASRVFERPGCGALQTIPIAAPLTAITLKNLVMPLPVIGSVLLDGGQALLDTAREQQWFHRHQKRAFLCVTEWLRGT